MNLSYQNFYTSLNVLPSDFLNFKKQSTSVYWKYVIDMNVFYQILSKKKKDCSFPAREQITAECTDVGAEILSASISDGQC